MLLRFRLLTMLAALFGSFGAQALSLGSDELHAAQRLGCVLADDALGYLDEEQFNRRFDEAVTDLSEAQVDVIYAKALGYIDGLLFGVPSGKPDAATRRLLDFSSSHSCSESVISTVSL
jgi:hypothetical protein